MAAVRAGEALLIRPDQKPAGDAASEQKRVPATPVPAAPETHAAEPGSAGVSAQAEQTPREGEAKVEAWRERHRELAAYLRRADADQASLHHELIALPAAALAARAVALEQRALWLSCSEADALQHACTVLGSPLDAAEAASPGMLERTPQERATDAALAQQQRSLKRKQPGDDDELLAFGGFSPLLVPQLGDLQGATPA